MRTGAVIITAETARKENAREVLASLSGFAGDFVVATAGPDLESILAARGAGIDQYSEEHHVKILHFDIGGGTSNLALYDRGELAATGCFDIGGRLVKLDPDGTIAQITPKLQSRFPNLRQGVRPQRGELEQVVQTLTRGLEQAAGLADTIVYELLTSISPRVPRICLEGGKIAD